MTENQVKDLFCQSYDIGQNEVKVLRCTPDFFSVEIQDNIFKYSYFIENNKIRFKPID
jgi:hypothetical protein